MTKLDANDIFKENPEFLPSHKNAMNLRNKYFAHSEDFGIDQAHMATKECDEGISIKFLYTLKIPTNEVESFISLFEFVEYKISSKLPKIFIKIENEIGKELRFENC